MLKRKEYDRIEVIVSNNNVKLVRCDDSIVRSVIKFFKAMNSEPYGSIYLEPGKVKIQLKVDNVSRNTEDYKQLLGYVKSNKKLDLKTSLMN
jgi:hypothetical protein